MKKYILGSIVGVLAILFATSGHAAIVDPLQTVWAEIGELRERLSKMEDGEGKGKTRSLRVVDANGKYVGDLMGHTPYGPGGPDSPIEVFNRDLQLFLFYKLSTAELYTNDIGGLLYKSSDCTGDAYTEFTSNHPYELLGFHGVDPARYWKADGKLITIFQTFNSRFSIGDDICESGDFGGDYMSKVKEFTPPSFVPPLRIVQ